MGLKPPRNSTRSLKWLALLGLSLLLSACLAKRGPGPLPSLGVALNWKELPGWKNEQLLAVWPALLRNCQKQMQSTPSWKSLCAAAAQVPANNRAEKAFIEQNFTAYALNNHWWQSTALITGYYVPVIEGSLTPNQLYRYPLYRPPDDLVRLDLGPHPGLPSVGRLNKNRVSPYPDRASIEAAEESSAQALLAGNEILWLNDPIERFFLQIQGSGRIVLPDGSSLAASYAANNGLPYHSIGRQLIEQGEMTSAQVNMYSLKQWLREHPLQRQTLFNSNPRYIFFKTRSIDHDWSPKGAFGLPLTPGRSLAVDTDKIALGSLLWLNTSLPGKPRQRYQHLMLAQDRGAAIKGELRVDLFWGQGSTAERLAATMKQPGRLYLLRPK